MMKVVVGVVTFIGFVIASSTAHAQTIKGKVVDTLQQPIPYMNVLLLHNVDKRILSFQQTDINGRFSVVIPEGYSSENYFLSMSALGYKRDTVLFSQADIAVDLTIEAQPDAIALQSVEVKGALPKISLKGDTINYHVKGFSDKYDRTIGDVLSKMPGIKVEDNGRIFYNGQAISKLYIDGDDVLEDKYNIGTRSIPHRVVEKVQVLKNHQKIKALRDQIFSDDVAINLTLDESAGIQLLGKGEIGAGLPSLFRTEGDIITLGKGAKSLNNVRLNNTGDDVSGMLLSLNQNRDNLRRGFSQKSSFLSAGTIGAPALPKERYFDNRSGLINTTNHFRLNEDAVIKGKAYYRFDKQDRHYKSLSEYYLPADTVRFIENQDSDISDQQAYGDFSYELNHSKLYLLNKTSFNFASGNENANLFRTADNLQTALSNRNVWFSNEFEVLKLDENQSSVNFFSYVNYQRLPEDYLVQGENFYPFMQDSTLEVLDQSLKRSYLFFNHYVSKRYHKWGLNQSYKVGTSSSLQELDSHVLGQSDDYQNALSYTDHRLYIEPDLQYNRETIKLNLVGKVQLQQIGAEDINRLLNLRQRSILYSSSFRIEYIPSAALQFIGLVSKSNDRFDMMRAYKGRIVRNYRTIQSNTVSEPDSRSTSASLTLRYEKPIKLFFANVRLSYNESSANYLDHLGLTDDYSIISQCGLDNTTNSRGLSVYATKYIFPLKLYVTINGAINKNQGIQWVNDDLLRNSLNYQSFEAQVDGKVTKYFSYGYQIAFQNMAYRTRQLTTRRTATSNHETWIRANISESTFLKFSHQSNTLSRDDDQKVNYNFMDLEVKHQVKVLNTDLTLKVLNVTNTRNFEKYAVSSTSLHYSSYSIRGRQILLSAAFLF